MVINSSKKIVCHLIYRFDIGGLERVMVNCINAMEDDNYQHVVIALTDVGNFSKHLNQQVKTYQLNKKPGKDLASHWYLFQLLRRIKPHILHTYNLAAIEYHPIAKLAGVKGHIHAEHGREINDPQGLNKKHNFLRKLMSPFIDYFTPVSSDLAAWLVDTVGIKSCKIKLIRNGIDTSKFSFSKKLNSDHPIQEAPNVQVATEIIKSEVNEHQRDENCIRFIHIARFNPVKDQQNLVNAFSLLVHDNNYSPKQLSLTLVGDGELTDKLKQLVHAQGLDDFVTFTGARNDIPALLLQANVFVLSSIAEGIPMTVLEAMAANLPVVSTKVGGVPELVEHEVTGLLVEKQNASALASAMNMYMKNPKLIKKHGIVGHQFIEQNFSETNMVREYLHLYNKSLGQS